MHPLFERLLNTIPRPRLEIDEISEALAYADEFQFTKAITGQLPLWIDPENHPEWVELWKEVRVVWKYPSLFSNVPIRDVIAIDCHVGAHLYPEKKLKNATNQMVRQVIYKFRNHAFIKSFVKDYQSNWEYFVEHFLNWRKFYANFHSQNEIKDIWLEKKSTREIDIYERLPFAKAASYVVEGVFSGFMDIFNVQGEIQALAIESNVLKIQVQWQ